jgi:hypothetical protein
MYSSQIFTGKTQTQSQIDLPLKCKKGIGFCNEKWLINANVMYPKTSQLLQSIVQNICDVFEKSTYRASVVRGIILGTRTIKILISKYSKIAGKKFELKLHHFFQKRKKEEK